MTAGFLLRAVLRESRGSRGRLAFFAACLAVGVAAVVAVSGIEGGLRAGVRARSREVLAADLSVDSRRPLPPELDALLSDQEGIERTDVRELATMAAVPGPDGKARKSRLCQLHAVRGRWPLYGEAVSDPPLPLERLLAPDAVVAAAELLRDLGIGVGDTLLVGGARFRVAGVSGKEPGRLGIRAMLGPRVYLSDAGLARTALLGHGNRVVHRALFRIPGDASRERLEALKERLEKGLPDAAFLDVDTHFDAEPGMARQMRRLESVAGLTALLSLVLGGIGVAQVVRAWLEGKAAAVATLRCLGLRPGEVLLVYLGHVAVLALAGSAAGAVVGSAVPLLVPALAPELFPPDLFRAFQAGAVLRGIGLGVGIALLFSLPPLTGLWRVAPARVLRAEAEPLPPARAARLASLAALALGVFAAGWAQGGTALRGAAFAAGFAVLAGLLALAARGLMRLSSLLPRERLGPYLRHAVAALARPGAGTTGAVVALGLGVTVVTGMHLVETRLLDGLKASIPPDAPSLFLVDIQPDRWETVRGALREGGATAVDHVPVVTARLASVDGVPVEDLATAGEDGERKRWVLTREQRLTWREALPADNRIVEGALWSDPGRAEASLEEGFARDMGAKVGSELVFDVQGVPVPLRVTSIRKVEWVSFAINFFVVVEPGTLDRAPAFLLANARLPEEAEQGLQDRLAAEAPGVTMIRLRPVLDRVLDLLRRVAFGIRVLGAFTVVAGLAILGGAVSSAAVRRARETALLKTLGVTRRGVALLLAAEHALCGLVAGAVGAGGALALAGGFLAGVADVEASLPLAAIPVSALGCALLTAACGLLAGAPALAAKPVESLRG